MIKKYTGIKRFWKDEIRQKWVNRFFKNKALLFVGWGRVNVKGGMLRSKPKIETYWRDLKTDELMVHSSVFPSVFGWVLGYEVHDGDGQLPQVVNKTLVFPEAVEEFEQATQYPKQGDTLTDLKINGEPDGFVSKIVGIDEFGHWVPSQYSHEGMLSQKAFYVHAQGKQFLIPLIELARALFLNKAYLARESFSPMVLPDFFVQHLQDESELFKCRITCAKSVPQGLYNGEEAALLEKITQILLVPTLKSSYHSIYSKMIAEQSDGIFDFLPPDLSSVALHLNVHEVQEGVFFVTEIVGVENVPSFDGSVGYWFEYAKKPENIGVRTSGGSTTIGEDGSETGVDDSGRNGPGMSKNMGSFKVRKITTTYRHESQIHKQSKYSQKSLRKRKSINPTEIGETLIGGFTEAQWGGKLGQMEFDSLENPEVTDFVQKIKNIAKNNGLDCLYEVFKVPRTGIGKYYIINPITGARRKAMCFSFKSAGKKNYDRFLIELERAEGEKISVLVVFASPDNKNSLLKEILAWCDLNKGHWSNEMFPFFHSNRPEFKIVRHQKIKHKNLMWGENLTDEQKKLNLESEKLWYQRIESVIIRNM